MTEFRQGIFQLIAKTSGGRAFVYTIGHIVISLSTVKIITGASWFDAGAVALIEPMLNGFWYYLLDRLWMWKFFGYNDFEKDVLKRD